MTLGRIFSFGLLACALLLWCSTSTIAQKQKKVVIPHAQTEVPGPPVSPAEAMKKMTLPPGFTVELVAAEPNLVNPVAMTFDEKGRIWITESLEYPRSSAGPGRDRIKVLESTQGDGVYDKITIFADGLNIPSGIAVGHGGVWVANAPDILFMQDTDGDGKADRKEVVVTGFGRFDTHELPNSLTWGPDGWLYGLNGVFNRSRINYRGKTHDFTCALFRIHPRTRDFEIFCEGTSNPWGVAFDSEGSAFVSACVIDHLWHLTETGYYHRQGGPYPPFTWKLESIVKHKHQKAAYCGIHYFDSDAYPPEYRERLYMGNIHGNCINVDVLQRDGSTYFAKPAPDFLSANDVWFMPVVQKTGPDGCLYILDWYDRYHCYQDARRDPEGIDRLRGRLYRIRYNPSPQPSPPGGEGRVRGAGKFDLAKESDDQLIQRLHSPNIFFRDIAQRLLCERNDPNTRSKLQSLVLDDKTPRKARMHALWALVGAAPLEPSFHQKLLAHPDATFRAWGVRAAGNAHHVEPAVLSQVTSLVIDPSLDVVLQVAIAAKKLAGIDPVPLLLQALGRSGQDKLLPPIVWQNLHPLLESRGEQFLEALAKTDLQASPAYAQLMARAVDRMLARRSSDSTVLVRLVRTLLAKQATNEDAAIQCMAALAAKVQTGELAGPDLAAIREPLLECLRPVLDGGAPPAVAFGAALLATTLRDPSGLDAARRCLDAPEQADELRLQALGALIAARDAKVLARVTHILDNAVANSSRFRGHAVSALERLDDPQVAEVVLERYDRLEPDIRPRLVELLTQRVAWAKRLLAAVEQKKIPATALNVNQVRKLLASKDAELIKQVKAHWGTIRESRDPAREKLVGDMRDFLRKTKGDPMAGMQVYKTVCGQCHKIHGEGQEVGPDITSNGRSDFDQLLSNVFDPSLVIHAVYQATTVVTLKGQTFTGLLIEDNPQRVVLKQQGGKLETIPRGDVESVQVSNVSLMPEGVEKQLKPQEIADLFAFLTLDKPPTDPTARKIQGAPR